jgi:hypothetical protein
MPLLGGATKLSTQPAPSGNPNFTGDPYSVFSSNVYGGGSPIDVFAGYEIDADGAIEAFTNNGNEGDVGRWDSGLGSLNKADYQFRFDKVSGLGSEGPLSDPWGVWLPATAGLNVFSIRITGNGNRTVTGNVRVRLAVSPFTEYDSATMQMSVAQEP